MIASKGYAAWCKCDTLGYECPQCMPIWVVDWVGLPWAEPPTEKARLAQAHRELCRQAFRAKPQHRAPAVPAVAKHRRAPNPQRRSRAWVRGYV